MIFDYTHLGNLLKGARESIDMKQSEVAELIGCSAANISSWERAKSKIDIESLVSLCNIYGINFSDLINKVHTKQVSEFTGTEKGLIKKYRALDNYGQEVIDKILDIEYRRCINQADLVSSLNNNLIPTVKAARSDGNNQPIEIVNLPDLSKFEPDDTDL